MLAFLSSLVIVAVSLATTVTVSNTQLRLTVNGSVVVAQDGNIANEKWNEKFVFIGMSYGLCTYDACANESLGACGFSAGRFLLWTSPTLGDGSWSEAIEILPASQRPGNAIYFRPHLIFNAQTQHWVLWVRYLPYVSPSLSNDTTLYLTATSPSLDAPFTVADVNVSMFYANSADDNLFVDPADGAAYIVHTARSTGTKIVVERLSSDYTYSLGADPAQRSALIGPGGTESPALFKVGALYYVTCGALCCYCAQGAAVVAYVAPAPLGPYAPAGGLGSAPRAQQNWVYSDPTQVEGVLWGGNRWGSDPSADPPSRPPLFDYSLQYWALLNFFPNVSVMPLVWSDNVTITTV